ncbi:MAG TPA: hypothetical protein DCX07_05295, partial [Phycisphaerales bacterium]|nr:hypothetical protein [Phycisphaerales bacterium]
MVRHGQALDEKDIAGLFRAPEGPGDASGAGLVAVQVELRRHVGADAQRLPAAGGAGGGRRTRRGEDFALQVRLPPFRPDDRHFRQQAFLA